MQRQDLRKVLCKISAEDTGIEPVVLPSTSPANAAFSVDKLVDIWGAEIPDICKL